MFYENAVFITDVITPQGIIQVSPRNVLPRSIGFFPIGEGAEGRVFGDGAKKSGRSPVTKRKPCSRRRAVFYESTVFITDVITPQGIIQVSPRNVLPRSIGFFPIGEGAEGRVFGDGAKKIGRSPVTKRKPCSRRRAVFYESTVFITDVITPQGIIQVSPRNVLPRSIGFFPIGEGAEGRVFGDGAKKIGRSPVTKHKPCSRRRAVFYESTVFITDVITPQGIIQVSPRNVLPRSIGFFPIGEGAEGRVFGDGAKKIEESCHKAQALLKAAGGVL